MESHSSNLDEIQKWFLQVLQHELPGKVYIKDIKYKEKDTTTKKNTPPSIVVFLSLGFQKNLQLINVMFQVASTLNFVGKILVSMLMTIPQKP